MNPQSSAILLPFRGSEETRKLRHEMRKHLQLIRKEAFVNHLSLLSREVPINSTLIVCPRMKLKRKSFQRWFILHNVLPDFSLACQSCRRCDVRVVWVGLAIRVV